MLGIAIFCALMLIIEFLLRVVEGISLKDLPEEGSAELLVIIVMAMALIAFVISDGIYRDQRMCTGLFKESVSCKKP